MAHTMSAVTPGATVPRCTPSDADRVVLSLRVTESMENATSSPFSLSMISGCCVVMETPVAAPKPALYSSTPMLAGSGGSTSCARHEVRKWGVGVVSGQGWVCWSGAVSGQVGWEWGVRGVSGRQS